MKEEFERSTLLFGDDYLVKLNYKHIAIFGIGGVGGYVVETLIRSGINKISLFDNDIVKRNNLNRQIIATQNSIGQSKVEVMKKRIIEINPEVDVQIHQVFVDGQTINEIDFKNFDYVVDAIDTVTSKLLIINKCKELDIAIISCMGTGNKISSEGLKIADIYKTKYCPLAKVMRKELKRMNVNSLDVLYSECEVIKKVSDDQKGRHAPASVSYVPSIAGIKIAEFILQKLIFVNKK